MYFFFMAGLLAWGMSIPSAKRAAIIHPITGHRALGLDTIYVQAKRWQGSVGRKEIQAFAGSLEGERATKGVFITTSCFSSEALEYVRRIGRKIVLIDGERLALLMIEHNVGCAEQQSFILKRVDNDYFEEL
jgi:restriction system protein